MRVERREAYRAAILTPEPGDDPADLEDMIHDEVLRGRAEQTADGKPAVAQVVLDLSGVPKPGPWMKAVGPEVPDTNLRVVLDEVAFATARALELHAVFEWYPDVRTALRGGV